MRLISLLLFASLCSTLQAQLLEPKSDWFDLENFFAEEEIKEHQIKSIQIKIEDKKDGEIIKHKGNFLRYEFDEKGRLIESMKSIPLAGKNDTSRIKYAFDNQDQLFRKSEAYGPFHFAYYYFYSQGRLIKELKIDISKSDLDTLYERSYAHEVSPSSHIIKTLNNSGKAYKQEKIELDNAGRKVFEKTTFSRGNSYKQHNFVYKKGRLSKKTKVEYFNHKIESTVEFVYKGELIEFVKLYRGKELMKKRAFTYGTDGLPKAVIEREYQEKSIRIYTFNYSRF